jgi:phosphatidylglycerol:prolipoprotein diacylglycerol transferase
LLGAAFVIDVIFPKIGFKIPVDANGIAFRIGSLAIHWYGLLISLGLLLAMLYSFNRAKKIGVDRNKLMDVVIAGLIGGIIGARLYYVIFSWEEYRGDIWSVFRIWKGGLAIYGGIIGAFAFAWLMCRIRSCPMKISFDLAAMGFLIGQSIGRWGNFVNQEAFGDNTNLPWGMLSAKTRAFLEANQGKLAAQNIIVDPAVPVHPTFLYESLWCALGFVVLHIIHTRYQKFSGQIFLSYGVWYGTGRFFIEGFRTDSLMIGTLRVSQILAALIVIVCLTLLIAGLNRTKRKALLSILPGSFNSVPPKWEPKEDDPQDDRESEDDGEETEEETAKIPAPVPNPS